MSFLVEDPWPLVSLCGVVAVGCLIGLRLTGRGALLLWAAGAAGLALLLLLADWLVVTDAERVEDAVRALAGAVARSDPDAAAALLAPDVSLEQERNARWAGGALQRGPLAIAAIRAALVAITFDFVHVSDVRVHVGEISRRATVDCRVDASGMFKVGAHYTFATAPNGSYWSFGLRETAPGTWKISRITAVRLPYDASLGGALSGQPDAG